MKAVRALVLACLFLATVSAGLADAGLRTGYRPQLYDPASDAASRTVLETLPSVPEWWQSSWDRLMGHHLRYSFTKISPNRLRVAREERWDRCLGEEKEVPKPEFRIGETMIWGSVLVLNGEYCTARITREESLIPDGVLHPVLHTGFGIPLDRHRVYFISGTLSSPEEILVAFDRDPYGTEKGSVTYQRFRQSRWSTFRTTYRATYKQLASSTFQEIAFDEPSENLPKLNLSSSLSKDPCPWLEGRVIGRFSATRDPFPNRWRW
jgi:hypothetical protein